MFSIFYEPLVVNKGRERKREGCAWGEIENRPEPLLLLLAELASMADSGARGGNGSRACVVVSLPVF